MGLSVFNSKGTIASSGNLGGNGFFELSNAETTTRIEAGTEKNDFGSVKVFGPTGNCALALAGFPCMIVGR
jgi:hypothetical protein